MNFFCRYFSRVTGSVSLIPQLDGLRAISMLLVLGHHVFAQYLVETHRLGTQQLPRDWGLIASRSPLVMWGLHLAFGVSIFCVISGFILAIPFVRSYNQNLAPPTWGKYILRRLIRLEPPYILNMLFMFVVLVVPFSSPRLPGIVIRQFYLPHLLASLVYLHGLIYNSASRINGVAWTLEIEVQFYLLLPFFAKVFQLRNAAIRRLLLASSIAGAALFAQFAIPILGHERLFVSIFVQLHFFLAGVLLADLYLDPPQWMRSLSRHGDLLALASAALLVFTIHWAPKFAVAEPFLVAACMAGTFRGALAGRLFASPWLTIPGCMSYTIYLYHVFFLHALMPWSTQILARQHALLLDVALQYVLMLVPVLVCSGMLYLFAERPFILLSHRIAQRWRQVPGRA